MSPHGPLFLEFWVQDEIGGSGSTYEKLINYNLNSVMISYIPRILESQNRFQSLCDEIFNIDDRFLE